MLSVFATNRGADTYRGLDTQSAGLSTRSGGQRGLGNACASPPNPSLISPPSGGALRRFVNFKVSTNATHSFNYKASNTCYDTYVWMNFCTQCQDCNNNATAVKGRWWKYEQEFLAYELDPYQTVQTALNINLEYQMLVDCEWEVTYGCDEGELN